MDVEKVWIGNHVTGYPIYIIDGRRFTEGDILKIIGCLDVNVFLIAEEKSRRLQEGGQ